jgi:hypothetical protein
MNYPQDAAAYQQTFNNFPQSCHPRMFLSEVQQSLAWIPAKWMRE